MMRLVGYIVRVRLELKVINVFLKWLYVSQRGRNDGL